MRNTTDRIRLMFIGDAQQYITFCNILRVRMCSKTRLMQSLSGAKLAERHIVLVLVLVLWYWLGYLGSPGTIELIASQRLAIPTPPAQERTS